jgi:hypothetical protein
VNLVRKRHLIPTAVEFDSPLLKRRWVRFAVANAAIRRLGGQDGHSDHDHMA